MELRMCLWYNVVRHCTAPSEASVHREEQACAEHMVHAERSECASRSVSMCGAHGMMSLDIIPLGRIFVSPEHHRKGYGVCMIQETERMSKSIDFLMEHAGPVMRLRCLGSVNAWTSSENLFGISANLSTGTAFCAWTFRRRIISAIRQKISRIPVPIRMCV